MAAKSRVVKWGLRFVSFSVWGMGTIFVIFSSFWILQFSGTSLVPPFIEKHLNYSAYSALPDNGSVLGHFIASRDARVAVLAEYLRYHNSPMAGNAADFIEAADRYDLPWTLLPAIAGKESGFGKAIPRNSYNPFGWAVYTGQQQGVKFNSWREAIFRVARGIREDYFNRGLNTPALMEPYYTPPSPGKGHPWLNDVTFFMAEISSW